MVPGLRSVWRATRQLREALERLATKFPDNHLEPDARILNRILRLDWRHLHGDLHGPHEERYWAAVEWVKRFDAYIGHLHGDFRYELEAPERLRLLPITNRSQLDASKLIRQLKTQQRMLSKWVKAAKQSERDEELEQLRSDLSMGPSQGLEGSGRGDSLLARYSE